MLQQIVKRLVHARACGALWTRQRTLHSSRTWMQVKSSTISSVNTVTNANVSSKQSREQQIPVNTTGNTNGSEEEDTPKYKPGWFSRNPGWTLGGIIFAIALYVYRSSKSKKNFEALQFPLADQAVISPYEAWELRSNNSITPDLFEQVWKSIFKIFPSEKATLSEFDRYLGFKLLNTCPQGMAKSHHLERVLMSLPKDEQQKSEIDAMLVAFGLAVKGSADERLECLFRLATRTPHRPPPVEGEVPESESTTISKQEFEGLLGRLLTTYQIPSEKRVVPVPDAAYPFQEYKLAEPSDLLQLATDAQVTAKELTKEQAAARTTYTLEEFTTLMKSKSICVWGECFTNKRKKMKN